MIRGALKRWVERGTEGRSCPYRQRGSEREPMITITMAKRRKARAGCSVLLRRAARGAIQPVPSTILRSQPQHVYHRSNSLNKYPHHPPPHPQASLSLPSIPQRQELHTPLHPPPPNTSIPKGIILLSHPLDNLSHLTLPIPPKAIQYLPPTTHLLRPHPQPQPKTETQTQTQTQTPIHHPAI